MSLLIVLCSFPDKHTAQRIAGTLVESHLAACVNLLPGTLSIYRWQGKIESSEEVLAIMKTTEEAYARLEAQLKELHPYDVPEIIAMPLVRAEENYGAWIKEMAGSQSPG